MAKSTEWFLSRVKLLTSSYRTQLLVVTAVFFLIASVIIFGNKLLSDNSKVEVLQTPANNISSSPTTNTNAIIIDISGSVENPGVYHLNSGSRVEDALIASGGLSENADRVWVERNLNKAAKLIDGQKIYIPNQQSNISSASVLGTSDNVAQSYTTSDSSLVNINNASMDQLDSLPGIGPVYAQKIVDQRPYSDINELLSKKVLSTSVYNKIKDKISVY